MATKKTQAEPMNPANEIAELKARVDRIEKWIRTFVSENQAPNAKETTYELISLDVKDVTQEYMLPTFAYKLQVRNISARELVLGGKIAFYDADGFELEQSPMAPFTMLPGSPMTVSGQATLMSKNNVSHVADIKAVLEVIR